jgi:hypothetical protein
MGIIAQGERMSVLAMFSQGWMVDTSGLGSGSIVYQVNPTTSLTASIANDAGVNAILKNDEELQVTISGNIVLNVCED